MTTVSKEMIALPFEEFKAYVEKVLPGEDAKKLYIDNGGKIPKKETKEKGE